LASGPRRLNFLPQNALFRAWQARANAGPDGKAILVASRLPLLHKAVLDACDGLVDGLISGPARLPLRSGHLALCR
jgi:Tannase and feruloyl esterase